jgi:hypothetical protein
VENLCFTADEELSLARTADSPAVSGTVGELDCTHSVNNYNPDTLKYLEDSMTESQQQRPKMKSGGKGGRGWGSDGCDCSSLTWGQKVQTKSIMDVL